MAKLTLLALVQNILYDLNSDNVNSITDTLEATQVAHIIKTTYFDLIADNTIPEHFSLGTLTSLSSLTYPNYLQVPSSVVSIKWIKYDTHTVTSPQIVYTPIVYKNPEDFIAMSLSNDSTASNIQTVTDSSGVKLLIRNDKFPQYYTSFDDEYLVFDSYLATTETFLTSSRSTIWANYEPVFTLSDSFVPDLDSNLFPLLLAEAKSLAFVNNAQASNPKIEQIAKRHQSFKQGRKHRLEAAERNGWVDFGRRR